jgi:glycerophosphoryl diester phosphodiesterase
LLLGHRGARRYAHENTFRAFDLALEHGCDGFEFDVRLTQDEHCVLLHDPRIKRRAVDLHSLADLTILCAPNGPASLAGVMERYSRRCFLDIELKVEGLAWQTLGLIERFRPQHVVASFEPGVIRELKNSGVPVMTGLNVRTRSQIRAFAALDPDVLVAHRSLLTAELVERMHRDGKKIFVWTVNSEREMLRFAGWGVDAIISDDTKLLAKTLL